MAALLAAPGSLACCFRTCPQQPGQQGVLDLALGGQGHELLLQTVDFGNRLDAIACLQIGNIHPVGHRMIERHIDNAALTAALTRKKPLKDRLERCTGILEQAKSGQ